MTYDENILFTKFMESKGVMNNFYSFYRLYKHDSRDLNTYLDEVDAVDVIMSAFDFTRFLNTSFGVKYWQEINDKWMAKLTEFRNTGVMSVEDLMVYCPHCGRTLPRSAFALKANMQLHKHCKECEGGKWDREKKEREKAAKEAEKQAKAMAQLEKEIADKQAKLDRLAAGQPAEPTGKILENARYETAKQQIAEGQANLDKTTKTCSHCGNRKLKSEFDPSDTTEDGLQSWCRTCQTAAANVSREAEFLLDRQEKKAVAKPVPVKPDKLTAPKLGEHDVTMHYKQQQKSLTLNAMLSAQIREQQLTKCYLKTERTRKMFLIFNRVDGSNVTGASNVAQQLLNVTSADITRQIAARFELTLGDNYYLHVTKNLARKDDTLTVEIVQARSREEYVKIAQRRDDVAKGKLPPYEALDGDTLGTVPSVSSDGEAGTTQGGLPPRVSPAPPSPAPLIDFSGPTPSSDPLAFIDTLVKAGHFAERDMATYLYNKGWELHEPVVVTKHKKFSL